MLEFIARMYFIIGLFSGLFMFGFSFSDQANKLYKEREIKRAQIYRFRIVIVFIMLFCWPAVIGTFIGKKN